MSLGSELDTCQVSLTSELDTSETDPVSHEEVDTLLSQHISRQSGGDRTDYVCLICQKMCKSRDECANHIEVKIRR